MLEFAGTNNHNFNYEGVRKGIKNWNFPTFFMIKVFEKYRFLKR